MIKYWDYLREYKKLKHEIEFGPDVADQEQEEENEKRRNIRDETKQRIFLNPFLINCPSLTFE